MLRSTLVMRFFPYVTPPAERRWPRGFALALRAEKPCQATRAWDCLRFATPRARIRQPRRPSSFIFRWNVARDTSRSFAALDTLPLERASARWRTARSAAPMSSLSAPARPMRSAAGVGRLSGDGVVPVDCKQRRPVPVASRREQDPRLGKGQTEVLRLDEPGRIGDCAGNQAREAFGQVAARGRHVKRRGQIPVFVKNRRGGAKQARVAGEEVLIAINGHRALFDDAGADAVGAFVSLAPDSACPKSRAVEEGIVARRAASVDDDPARVSQHDRTADAADSEKEAIDASLRGEEQRAHPFARLCDLVLGQPL